MFKSNRNYEELKNLFLAVLENKATKDPVTRQYVEVQYFAQEIRKDNLDFIIED